MYPSPLTLVKCLQICSTPPMLFPSRYVISFSALFHSGFPTRNVHCRKDSTLICRKIFHHPKLAKGTYLEVRTVGACKGQLPTKKAQGLYGASYGQRFSSKIFRVEIGQVSTPELSEWLDFMLSCWLVLSSRTGWFQLSEIVWFHVQLVRGRMCFFGFGFKANVCVFHWLWFRIECILWLALLPYI